MKLSGPFMSAAFACCTVVASSLAAQDLGPNVRKVEDGIYVQSAREVSSNVGIVLTTEGVVLIDTGQTPVDWREVQSALEKLTPLPVPPTSTPPTGR